MKQLIVWGTVVLLVVALLKLGGLGLQALASVMTLILHPWVFAPIFILAIVLVLVWNSLFRK